MYLTSFLKEKKLFVSLIWLAKHICDWCDWLVALDLERFSCRVSMKPWATPPSAIRGGGGPRERGGGVELFTTALRSFDRQIAEEKNETYKEKFSQPKEQNRQLCLFRTCVVSIWCWRLDYSSISTCLFWIIYINISLHHLYIHRLYFQAIILSCCPGLVQQIFGAVKILIV